jgi:hypothetical protein
MLTDRTIENMQRIMLRKCGEPYRNETGEQLVGGGIIASQSVDPKTRAIRQRRVLGDGTIVDMTWSPRADVGCCMSIYPSAIL